MIRHSQAPSLPLNRECHRPTPSTSTPRASVNIMWLAAENEIFLSIAMVGEWTTTMPENLYKDSVDSVKHVFEYFTERIPRSHLSFV